MKKLVLTIVLAVVVGVCTLTGSHAQDIGKKEQALSGSQWLPASGTACAKVCEQNGEVAAYTGTYKNGNPFFICRANAHGEGYRPGFNLQPDWARDCWVGWGGKEEAMASYDCLCTR